jgi:sarcosine oxidase subunit beta
VTAVTADVVIVGAGIMGVSTAYHLARRGAGRIVVVERDDVCSGSTALASGAFGTSTPIASASS